MTTSELVAWIDARFESMMTRPGMWVGQTDCSFDMLELQFIQLLEFRFMLLCGNLEINIEDEIRKESILRKFRPRNASVGFARRSTSELDCVIKIRTIWDAIINKFMKEEVPK